MYFVIVDEIWKYSFCLFIKEYNFVFIKIIYYCYLLGCVQCILWFAI